MDVDPQVHLPWRDRSLRTGHGDTMATARHLAVVDRLSFGRAMQPLWLAGGSASAREPTKSTGWASTRPFGECGRSTWPTARPVSEAATWTSYSWCSLAVGADGDHMRPDLASKSNTEMSCMLAGRRGSSRPELRWCRHRSADGRRRARSSPDRWTPGRIDGDVRFPPAGGANGGHTFAVRRDVGPPGIQGAS